MSPKDAFQEPKSQTVAEEEAFVVKVFGGAADAGDGTGTKQLPKDHFENAMGEQVVQPLYDPMVWAFLLEQNTRLKKLVGTMADNTVGLGWEIVPRKEEESFEKQYKTEIETERAKFVELLEAINPLEPFTEVAKKVKVDEESTGQGYFEVIRAQGGTEVKQLWHLPSHTIRLAKPSAGDAKRRDRYVQMRPSDPSKKVWFKAFGEEGSLDAKTGKWEEEEAVTDPANEIIQFKLYTPRSSYYGVPRVVSAAPAIAGTRLAQRRNVAFFENDAMPRAAIIVQGGELSEESMKMIKEFMDARGKGPGNAGRLMVLQARGSDDLMGDASKLSIDLIPLTVGVQDDASFQSYLAANNEEVREAFGIGQIFIGTSDDVNRAVALAMKQLTVEQVFEPESTRYEYMLNRVVMDTNGAKYTKLRFKRPRTIDTQAESQAFSMLAAAGGVTPNDVRDFQRKPRFSARWSDTPLALLRAGLLEAKGGEGDGAEDVLATLHSVYGERLPALMPPPEKPAPTAAKVTADEDMFDAAFGPEYGAVVRDEVQSIARGLEGLGFKVNIAPRRST